MESLNWGPSSALGGGGAKGSEYWDGLPGHCKLSASLALSSRAVGSSHTICSLWEGSVLMSRATSLGTLTSGKERGGRGGHRDILFGFPVATIAERNHSLHHGMDSPNNSPNNDTDLLWDALKWTIVLVWTWSISSTPGVLASEPPEYVCSRSVRSGSHRVCAGPSRPLRTPSCWVGPRSASPSSAWWRTWSPGAVFAGSLSFLESLKHLDTRDETSQRVVQTCRRSFVQIKDTHRFCSQLHSCRLYRRSHRWLGVMPWLLLWQRVHTEGH